MRQVIHHIVLNAREAMPEGGIIDLLAQNITLKTKAGPPLKEGEYIKLSIKDHGPGISEENLSKIFDPYFTTKEKGSQKGMGLGLTICYSVIKNHQGLITVESQVGVGTTFHIFLPSSKKEIQAEVKVPHMLPQGRGKVLVMDDEEAVREIAVNMLRYMGYEVEFAIEGMEVIKRYKEAKEVKQPFHAVILDLTVQGGMGGKETIKRLKEIDPNVKAIVSSGYSNDPIIFEFEQHGFKGALTKPYNFLKLSETISRVMSEPR
jgi:CheY-like chemotaxis protein